MVSSMLTDVDLKNRSGTILVQILSKSNILKWTKYFKQLSELEGWRSGRKWRWWGESEISSCRLCTEYSHKGKSIFSTCLLWCRRPGDAWQNTTCYPEPACLEESGWNPQLDWHGSEKQRKRQVRHRRALQNPLKTFILLGQNSPNVLFFWPVKKATGQKKATKIRRSFCCWGDLRTTSKAGYCKYNAVNAKVFTHLDKIAHNENVKTCFQTFL